MPGFFISSYFYSRLTRVLICFVLGVKHHRRCNEYRGIGTNQHPYDQCKHEPANRLTTEDKDGQQNQEGRQRGIQCSTQG